MKQAADHAPPITVARGPARKERRLDLELVSDRIALAVGSTRSFYAHLAFYGGLFGLGLVGVPYALILLIVATIVSLEGVFLVIFVQRSASQQAARLEEAIAVIRHNTADHLSEPLDVVIKDMRRELREMAIRVVELGDALQHARTDPRGGVGAAADTAALAAVGGGPEECDGGSQSAKRDVDVVVVDDDAAICELVREVLRDTGYSVLTATSGEQAMAVLNSSWPRLILADLDMPAMSGWALRAWLRAHEGLQNVPVILLSGSAQIVRETALLGAQGYIAKPFDIDHLLRVIDEQILTRP